MPVHDLFHAIRVTAPVLAHTAMTASTTDCTVVDLRNYPQGSVVGFVVHVPTVTTVDASNYFTFKLFEADEKASATALTAGTVVANDDILGLVENDVLLDTDDMASVPVLTVNASGQAGKTYFFQYRGYKPCIQLQPTETGTSAVTASAFALISSGATVNTKPEVIS